MSLFLKSFFAFVGFCFLGRFFVFVFFLFLFFFFLHTAIWSNKCWKQHFTKQLLCCQWPLISQTNEKDILVPADKVTTLTHGHAVLSDQQRLTSAQCEHWMQSMVNRGGWRESMLRNSISSSRLDDEDDFSLKTNDYMVSGWFSFVLWHINNCRLFIAKPSLYVCIEYLWFGWVGFYGISNIADYLMSNYLYTYILNIYDLVWLGFMAYKPFIGHFMPNPLYTY